MKRYLLDTGVAQRFINNDVDIVRRVDQARNRQTTIGICIPVLGELWAGVVGSHSPEKNRHKLLSHLSRFVVWPYSKEAAKEYGRLLIELKRAGRPIGQIDIQIAAIALTLGQCMVVTKDNDFSAIPGLPFETWS